MAVAEQWANTVYFFTSDLWTSLSTTQVRYLNLHINSWAQWISHPIGNAATTPYIFNRLKHDELRNRRHKYAIRECLAHLVVRIWSSFASVTAYSTIPTMSRPDCRIQSRNGLYVIAKVCTQPETFATAISSHWMIGSRERTSSIREWERRMHGTYAHH